MTSSAWLTSELVDDDAAPVRLFDGATNLRVAQVHMASRPVAKCAAPPFEVFVTELSYRGSQYVHVVPTDHSLEFPIEVAIQNVKPPYTTEELTYTLNGMEPRNLDVPKYRFGCVPTDLVVRFKHKGMEFYRYETVVLNSQTMAPASGRMLRNQSYRVLFGEFKALNDALTVPNAVPGPAFDAKTRGFFACLKKTRADKRKGIASKSYLIVASDLYKPETRTMVCPELAGKTAKALFGSKRGCSSGELVFDASGRAALTMPPLSSAVFEVE